MSEADVRRVIQGLDQVLRVFRQNEGRLTGAQIRARSMLSIVRSEIAQSLADGHYEHADGLRAFVMPDAVDGLANPPR